MTDHVIEGAVEGRFRADSVEGSLLDFEITDLGLQDCRCSCGESFRTEDEAVAHLRNPDGDGDD